MNVNGHWKWGCRLWVGGLLFAGPCSLTGGVLSSALVPDLSPGWALGWLWEMPPWVPPCSAVGTLVPWIPAWLLLGCGVFAAYSLNSQLYLVSNFSSKSEYWILNTCWAQVRTCTWIHTQCTHLLIATSSRIKCHFTKISPLYSNQISIW